jgi:SAM-dependent methyltransferase
LRLPIRLSDYTFVDLGCGKGRALIVALELSFARVIGVDISPSLVAIARRNLQRVRPAAVEQGDAMAVCADARAYELPAEDTVLFLYNPFPRHVMQELVERLVRSLEQTPRDLIVIYVNDVDHDVFDAAPCLERRERVPYPDWRLLGTLTHGRAYASTYRCRPKDRSR